MLFSEIILKNLGQRPTRTALTAVGLAVAVMAVTTLWNIAWGYADSANSYYSSRGVDIVVVRAGVSNRLTSSLRTDLIQRLASLPGIDSVDGSLTEMVSLGESHMIGVPLRGLVPGGFTLKQLPISSGESLKPGDRSVALLGAGIAEALNKGVGKHVEIEGKAFRVVGIFTPANPFDSNSIVAPLEDVQKLMERSGIVSELQVRAGESAGDEVALDQLCRTIEQLRDDQQQPLGLKAQPTHAFVDTATESTLGKAMAWATTAIVFTLSLFGMLNAMLMSVLERTHELGILRAIGWRRTRVIRMILSESFAISLVGAILGSVAAWILLRGLAQWSKTSLLVPPTLSVSAVLLGFVAAISAGVVGSFIPAFRAASAPPIESLRHE